MRIVFRAHPAYGHIYPLMPLAFAARAAGHEIIFPTVSPFADRLAALGFRTASAGTTMGEAWQRRFGDKVVAPVVDGDTNWDVLAEFFAEADLLAATDLRVLLPELAPDLVIYDDTDLGAAAAAAEAGIPAIAVAITRSPEPRVYEMFYGRPIDELRTRFGAVPRPDNVLLDAYPPSVQRAAFLDDPRRSPLRVVPWSDPAFPIPERAGTRRRALGLVTLGTVANSVAARRQILEALAPLDLDLVVATGLVDPAELGELPNNIHVERFVRQSKLLPKLDLIVHNGGAGTTSGGWTHGVPQLVLPDGADRFVNADAVASSGSGIALRGPTMESITTSAATLLETLTYRQAAQRIRDEIAMMPHPVEVLAELTSRSARSSRVA
jgi:UDP:flavonoid glycosyltransferase YjiC (YdhE family)